jgi:uncharacterized protein with HEPN domain
VNDDRLYLEHIGEALRDIASYSSAGREAFFRERMRQDAILRKLEVIGQAVKISPKKLNPDSLISHGSRLRECAIKSFTTTLA